MQAYFFLYFIKISFPVHFLFKWRQNLSARPRTFIRGGERRLSTADSSFLLLSIITQPTRTNTTSGVSVRSQSPSDANKKKLLEADSFSMVQHVGIIFIGQNISF